MASNGTEIAAIDSPTSCMDVSFTVGKLTIFLEGCQSTLDVIYNYSLGDPMEVIDIL